MQRAINSQPSTPLIYTSGMPLYPTAGSLEEVVSLGKSQLPIMDENTLFVLLMTMLNTLIAELQKEGRLRD